MSYTFFTGCQKCVWWNVFLVSSLRGCSEGMVQDPATRCDEMGRFPAILSFQKHRRPSQSIEGVPIKLQQCGKSATHDGLFPYSPAIFIAGMVIRNI